MQKVLNFFLVKYILSQKCKIQVCQNKVAALHEALSLLKVQQTEGIMEALMFISHAVIVTSDTHYCCSENVHDSAEFYFRKGVSKQDNRRK